MTVEATAREANSQKMWDELWSNPESRDWRGEALTEVYNRIEALVPQGSRVLDLGGGVGTLAKRISESKAGYIEVWEQSEAARALVPAPVVAHPIDLENFFRSWPEESAFTQTMPGPDEPFSPNVIMATEVLEHLSESSRAHLLTWVMEELKDTPGLLGIFSVPNNRLGPDEEPQHTIKWTALEYLTYMRGFFGASVRVEVYGPYLVAVVGEPKGYTLSVTLPVRDEAEDLERTLASFRGVADEIVVGVDPRTKDATREIARQYAEVVFDLVSPRGVGDEQVSSEDGVHFSWLRNQCIEKCTSEWIFMTEGHEELHEGQDTLLALKQMLPPGTQVLWVLRTGQGQQWGYPWMYRKDAGFRYKRATHNELQFPESTPQLVVPTVKTLHFRAHNREVARKNQRKYHNRLTLLSDWVHNENAQSLFYLASEEREHDPQKAIARMQEFLRIPGRNGAMRYHARLILAKTLALEGQRQEAMDVLLPATGDDWSRAEHWMYLGDLAFEDGNFEQAYEYYRHMAVRMGRTPFTVWWIDLAAYTYLPAQRLAVTCGELGKGEEALYWARKVKEFLPKDSPEVAFQEADANIALLEDAIHGQQPANPE